MLRRSTIKAKRDTPRRNEGRVTHERMTPKASAKPSAAEKAHLGRVASLGCVVQGCNQAPQVHHVHSDGMKRIARSPRRVVGLCLEHHTVGPCAVHRIGHARFTEIFGIDLLETADRLWRETDG